MYRKNEVFVALQDIVFEDFIIPKDSEVILSDKYDPKTPPSMREIPGYGIALSTYLPVIYKEKLVYVSELLLTLKDKKFEKTLKRQFEKSLINKYPELKKSNIKILIDIFRKEKFSVAVSFVVVCTLLYIIYKMV